LSDWPVFDRKGVKPTVTISGLLVGTTYYFAAQSVDTNELQSVLSQEISYTIPPPPAPAHLQMALQPGSQVLLTGTGPVGYQYNVQAGSTLTNWTTIGSITADTTGALQFSDPGATNSPRFYRLQQTYP
jgi:hypothetical protein